MPPTSAYSTTVRFRNAYLWNTYQFLLSSALRIEQLWTWLISYDTVDNFLSVCVFIFLAFVVAVPRTRKFFLKFLGSIEVSYHRGNDVLCQAINKVDCYHHLCFICLLLKSKYCTLCCRLAQAVPVMKAYFLIITIFLSMFRFLTKMAV